MPSVKSIKQRIKSVKNTSQITKAMEVVSATKMRKSQEFALRARPFAIASLEMMQNLLVRTPTLPPILTPRDVKKSLLLVITSDKGLAGAFNANILKKAEQWIEEKRSRGVNFTLITVGKKAKEYCESRTLPIEKSFWGFGDFSSLEETLPIAQTILDGFNSNAWDEVISVYTHFRTTLLQVTVQKKILPATEEGLRDAVKSILPEHGKYAEMQTAGDTRHVHYNFEYKFEPSPTEILEALVPQIIRMHVHHVILESNASEHSARMVAMKNATDNAKDLISDLTITYNKVRQAGITRELTEITAGKEALEG